jgi:hypothetical protein
MLKCENHYFQIREDYLCGLFDCAFISMELDKLIQRLDVWNQNFKLWIEYMELKK